ncbi:hypothetical protein Tco_1466493 [Tanacetum coccineum]
MKELRCNLFAGTEDEDAYEHVRRVLEIAYLFHIPDITHDAIMLRKVQIFYTGLDIPSCKMIDSQGFIHIMTPAQALKSIQVMADHSHNWYDGAATRQGSNDSSDDIDMQKLKENIHVIQETVNKYYEESIKEQAAINEWIRKFIKNTDLNLKKLDAVTRKLEVMVEKLTQAVLTNEGNTVERVKENMEKAKEVKKEPVP